MAGVVDAALAKAVTIPSSTIHVSGMSDDETDRYPALLEELVVDLSALDATARERLLTVVHRAIDQHCTVGRTLEAGATVQLTVTGER